MSIFKSPACHSVRMDQDQTEDAMDDMLRRICLQSDDPDILEQEERDQL